MPIIPGQLRDKLLLMPSLLPINAYQHPLCLAQPYQWISRSSLLISSCLTPTMPPVNERLSHVHYSRIPFAGWGLGTLSTFARLPEPRKLFTKKAHGLMVVRAICNSRSTNAYRSLLRRPDLCDKWLPLRPALTHLINRRLALDLSLGFLLFGCNIQIVLTLIVVIRPRTTVALNKSDG
ncbi:hypothetical protein WN944_023873 [Citrus x changshan-huyou]|uniref:Uncharacterized protein n=1 Tax=Citrus x changshan-huyou TaxID=2935761 RepID=A0AAP0QA46_9ROSI